MVKAPDCGSGDHGFESHYPPHFDPLAQAVEHLTFNQGVRRSSRRWVTILAGVAELADALDLGSSVIDVGVQVLSPAPKQIGESQFFLYFFEEEK